MVCESAAQGFTGETRKTRREIARVCILCSSWCTFFMPSCSICFFLFSFPRTFSYVSVDFDFMLHRGQISIIGAREFCQLSSGDAFTLREKEKVLPRENDFLLVLLTSERFLTDKPSCSIAWFVLPIEVGGDDATFPARKMILEIIPVHEVRFTAVQPCHDSVIVHITNTDPSIRNATWGLYMKF